MRSDLAYLIYTVSTWLSISFLLIGVWKLAHYFFGGRVSRIQGLIAPFGVSLAFGIVSVLFPFRSDLGGIPVVWLLTSWTVVGAIACALGAAFSFAKLRFGVTNQMVSSRTLIGWLGAFAFFVWLSIKTKAEWTVFRGTIQLSSSAAVILVGSAILCILVFALILRSKLLAQRALQFARTAFLILGSFVFCVPFVWLVLGSLREDRDILHSDRLNLVPIQTQKTAFFDPTEPHYEAAFSGAITESKLVREIDASHVELQVIHPYNLQQQTFIATKSHIKLIPSQVPLLAFTYKNIKAEGFVKQIVDTKTRIVEIVSPVELKGTEIKLFVNQMVEVRKPGLRWSNYRDALEMLPQDMEFGWVYLRNTLIIVCLSVIGVVTSCTLVAYAFARLKFYGKNFLFMLLMSTMMLPGAVTMLPKFLIFRSLGWVDTLNPLWVPSFFTSAFNVFLLRQFFFSIPTELEDAAKIDGCSYVRTLTSVMLPQIKPALIAISVFTAKDAWNNFLDPLIYISSPQKMPISYALSLYTNTNQLFEPGLVLAATTMSILPVVMLFFVAQRYFVEGISLSGLGGK